MFHYGIFLVCFSPLTSASNTHPPFRPKCALSEVLIILDVFIIHQTLLTVFFAQLCETNVYPLRAFSVSIVFSNARIFLIKIIARLSYRRRVAHVPCGNGWRKGCHFSEMFLLQSVIMFSCHIFIFRYITFRANFQSYCYDFVKFISKSMQKKRYACVFFTITFICQHVEYASALSFASFCHRNKSMGVQCIP